MNEITKVSDRYVNSRIADGHSIRSSGQRFLNLRRIIYKGSRRAKLVFGRFLLRLGRSAPVLSQYLSPIGRGLTTFKTWCTTVDTLSASDQRVLAGQYLRIRESEAVRRSPPISLDDNQRALFEKGINYYQYGYRSQIPEVFLARIPKARIWGSSFLVVSPDNLIFSDSIWADSLLKETGVLDSLKPLKVNYRSGPYALLGAHWWQGYYHWVLDVLPRISVLECFDQWNQIPLIIPEGTTNQQYESLRMVGISSNRITRRGGEYWEVDLLYFPSVLGGTGNPSPWAVSWLRDRLLNGLRFENTRLLYVTRRDARSRRIVNEERIVKFLRRQGFEIICPGELSFSEQVRLFAQARVVIGPHGSGLTNMIFAPRNALLIELFPENYINGCYWALANACSQTYGFLAGTPDGTNFQIDVYKIEALLEKALNTENRFKDYRLL
jgi:hypothetical protein